MNQPKIITGRSCRWIVLQMWIQASIIILKETGSVIHFVRALRKLIRFKNQFLEDSPINKLIRVNNTYYWDVYQAGFPGSAFNQNISWLVKRHLSGENHTGKNIRFVMLAITKKCPLNCEHCYEWDEINRRETLSPRDLVKIVSKYQSLGASQFFIGGGEPLSRFRDLLELLKNARKASDFWLTTSAYGLSHSKALELKKAGLTGVIVSLDHFNPESHNTFRGNHKSFDHVVNGIINAQQAGLVTALSICTTREFISKNNLETYLELAKQLNVGFIQLVEPRAEGRYKDKDVMLRSHEYEILDEFYLRVNSQTKYQGYPKIIHPSYDQRKYGCAGAGSRFIMIDTDGYLNACPFCRSKKVHALDNNFSSGMIEINSKGCYKFEDRVY